MNARCPECDGAIEVPDDVVLGEILPCPDCGTEFEVFKVDNGHVELKVAEVEGEDWGE
ncbi:MAG: alpha-aminoadipate/glutamate carrier protein LysW/ArgW [Candidatus Bathyarchaeia archaeon]